MKHLGELNDKLTKLKEEIEKMPKSKIKTYNNVLLDDLEQFKD